MAATLFCPGCAGTARCCNCGSSFFNPTLFCPECGEQVTIQWCGRHAAKPPLPDRSHSLARLYDRARRNVADAGIDGMTYGRK